MSEQADQRAIPDRLAEVRERLKELQAEETALREILLTDPSARIGGDYIAMVHEHAATRVQSESLKAADPELWKRLAVRTTVQQVRLVRRREKAA